ncbi:unnamed protein product [Symbiodinium sp. CCMP2592]|nr:unnamed protein product [Symbiodinium sp. CCMP2592]
MALVVPSAPLVLPAPRLPGAPEDLSREALASPGESSGSLKAPKPAVSDRTLNMQIIERVSHVCILNSQSVNHVEEALEDEIGCKLLIAVRRPMFGVIGLLALSAGSLLVLFASAGFACSSSYGMTIASTVLYGLLAMCCGGLLRTALLSEDLHLAFSKLSRFGSADLQGDWLAKRVIERRRYIIFALFLVANMCGTWALDFWSSMEDCEEQGGHPGPMMYSVAALSLISFVLSSSLVVLAAYIHSQLLIGLDLILDFWVSDVVTNADFSEGVRSWNSMQALLKSAGRELGNSFLALQVAGGLGLMIWLGDGITFLWRRDLQALPLSMEILSAMPLVLLFLLTTRLCAHGAALTEKCRAIPAMVNQIPGQSIDMHRQYLVRFIADSAAGFIIRGVTLTQAIFLRQVYFLGTLFSGLLGVLIRIYL